MTLTSLVYNCDPESLGDISQEAFAAAFDKEVRAAYPNVAVTVTFKPGKSKVSEYSSTDGDNSDPACEAAELHEVFAERAFRACCEA